MENPLSNIIWEMKYRFPDIHKVVFLANLTAVGYMSI